MDSNVINENDGSDSNDKPKTLLVDVKVSDQNSALNLMIAFLSVAQKRGAFNMQESAKLWECIKKFTDVKIDTSSS